MQLIATISPVVLPVLFWAAYHYYKDRHLPEPPQYLLLGFCLGLVAAGLSKGLYVGLEPLGLRYDAVALAQDEPKKLFWYAILAIGPIEELAKMLPFLFVIVRLRVFDEPLDGLVYAAFIALGYALAENLYYLDFLSSREALARGFAAPVVHIVFASIWADRVTRAILAKRSVVLPAFFGFVFAAFLHGLYDFLVLLRPFAALPAAASLIVAIWLWRLRLMRKMHRDAVQRSAGSSGRAA